jgi:hypothetical protein
MSYPDAMPGPAELPVDPDAIAYCDGQIAAFRSKADHNKRESQLCFSLVIATSLAAPMFVTLGEGQFWGKILPSVLSLVAAAATAWLQLRKPQQLWALYRDAQRRLEDLRTRFAFKIEPFQGRDRHKRLAEGVADIALRTHERWLPIVPSSDNLPNRTPSEGRGLTHSLGAPTERGGGDSDVTDGRPEAERVPATTRTAEDHKGSADA